MSLSLTLQQLVAPWLPLSGFAADIAVAQLELDSRKVISGTTFVAIKGHATDGRQFIDAALNNGANAVIAQACSEKQHGQVARMCTPCQSLCLRLSWMPSAGPMTH